MLLQSKAVIRFVSVGVLTAAIAFYASRESSERPRSELQRRPASISKPTIETAGKDCYRQMATILRESLRSTQKPLIVHADGTKVPISRAFEKEGLPYRDISPWFDSVDPVAFEKKLRERLQLEKQGRRRAVDMGEDETRLSLRQWFTEWQKSTQYRAVHSRDLPEEVLKAKDPEEILDFMLDHGNPFDLITHKGREDLIYAGFLDFDDVRTSARTPAFLTVGDDLGSYEVRSVRGEANLRLYPKQRALVEEKLESPVGHQHVVHAWPESKAERAKLAPKYIDLLDSTTWYLFWRQAKRDPENVESIIPHPYLGVYNRKALDKLHDVVVEGDAKKFNNKFRFVGARSLPGDPTIQGQAGIRMADFELRSGNKSKNRAFTESMLLSRISTGDYSGLKDFRVHKFDASAPLEDLTQGILPEADIAILKEFEEKFPPLQWSGNARAYNHLRNKIVAPLLPWEKRVDLGTKLPHLQNERKIFAERMVEIGKKFLKKEKDAVPGAHGTIGDLRNDTFEELQEAIFDYADSVQLDKNFERILMPRPKRIPDILVKSSGSIDVNEIDLGIEYSFRFPTPPKNKAEADKLIQSAAEQFKKKMGGGTVEKIDEGGHGHGLSVRYIFTDLQNRKWRVEWDGIRRSYRDQDPYWSRRGHIEVPTPKFAPKNMDDVKALYSAMRGEGNFPMRSAGGGHINVDLSKLQALPEKEGARKMANLLAYFESNREMTSALWQHPFRRRSAMPVEIDEEFIYKLSEFDGTWDDLGKLLYDSKYFNTYMTRKPGYTQLNAMALMGDQIPEAYQKTIDIKKPGTRWFPSFGGKGKDRIEWRMFDAPEDEYVAALQIKYVRALLNEALNAEGAVPLIRRYSDADTEIWKNNPSRFLDLAEAHLKELGLDVEEFAPALRESLEIQQSVPQLKHDFKKYNNFKTRIQVATKDQPGIISPQQITVLKRDMEKNTKTLREAREAFVGGMSARKMAALIDEHSWAMARLRKIMADDARILRAPAMGNKESFQAVVELRDEIERAATLFNKDTFSSILKPAERRKYKDLIASFFKDQKEFVNGNYNFLFKQAEKVHGLDKPARDLADIQSRKIN